MTKEEIEAYEHNLKLYNDSISKDLDIILTSTIPNQKNLMKTLLWLNTTIIGLLFFIIKNNLLHSLPKGLNILPIVLSIISIVIILIALKKGRKKTFGSPDTKQIEDIPNDKWTKSQGLSNMSKSFLEAYNSNKEIVEERSNNLSNATTMTIITIAIISFLGIIQVNIPRNHSMPDEEKPTISKSPTKPNTSISTNSTQRRNDTVTESHDRESYQDNHESNSDNQNNTTENNPEDKK